MSNKHQTQVLSFLSSFDARVSSSKSTTYYRGKKYMTATYTPEGTTYVFGRVSDDLA